MNQQQIEKALSQLNNNEIMSYWERLTTLLAQRSTKPQVVVAGMVKSGKSTLCNAIVGAEDRFATGAVRTTVQNEEVDCGDYLLIDTPGVHANDEDTAEAEQAYRHADTILFVHNLIEGELLKQEVDFLHRLQANFPKSTDFWKRVLFIFTNAGQLGAEKAQVVQQQIHQQIHQLFQQQPFSLLTDAISYFKGIAENKKLLQEHSGIPTLIEQLSKQVEQSKQSVQLLRQDRVNREAASLKQWINTEINIASKQTSNSTSNTNYEQLLQELNVLQDTFNTKKAEFHDFVNSKKLSYEEPRIWVESPPYTDYDYKSEYSAKQAARSEFSSYYHNNTRVDFDSKVDDILWEYEKKCMLEQNSNNHYYSMLTSGVKLLNEIKTNLIQTSEQIDGINLKNISVELKTQPKSAGNLGSYGSEFSSKVGSSSEFMEKYSFRLRIRSTTRTEYGLFGGSKQVYYYRYDIDGLVEKLEERVNYALSRIDSKLYNKVSPIFSKFQNDVLNDFDAIWTQLHDQLEVAHKFIQQRYDEEQAQQQAQSNHIKNLQQLLTSLDKLVG